MIKIEYASTVETKIANKLIEKALAKGYFVSVFDGEETTVEHSQDVEVICKALASTDCDIVRFYQHDLNGDLGKIGWVQLIWGNEDDLISDHTDNEAMEELCRYMA